MFHDRIEAGSKLAKKLKKYQKEDGIILAVPRGGVAVAGADGRVAGDAVHATAFAQRVFVLWHNSDLGTVPGDGHELDIL